MKRIYWKNTSRCFILLIVLCGSAFSHAEKIEQLAATCVACHGEEGISPNDLWPNLAGQQVDYLIVEMKAFRDGVRVDPLMSPSLKGYSDQQIRDLANYYSNLPAAENAETEVNTDGHHVRALCVSCHGMTGNTVTSLWPNLAGQKAGYLKKQLMDFKTGVRKGPVMEVIAKELTDEQIANVAEYFSQI